MKSNVISLADYKRKQALPNQVIVWSPQVHFFFIPPFFWGMFIL